MLYVLFLSRFSSLWHTALYQSSMLDPFIALDYNWGSGNKILKSDKTDVFYKPTIKNIIYNIFRLTRAYVYMIYLSLYRQKSLSFIILLSSKSTLISLALNTILFFYFPFSSDNKSGNNSIYLPIFT